MLTVPYGGSSNVHLPTHVVGETEASLGAEMVMLMVLYGELPGRPEGEKVVRWVISHRWRGLVAVAREARARDRLVMVMKCMVGVL